MRRLVLAGVLTLVALVCATWPPARDALVAGKEALLGGVSVMTGEATADRGKMTAQMLLRRRLEYAMRQYRSVHGSDPETLQDLVDEGLLQAGDLVDPWGGHLAFERTGRKLRIRSDGPDGQPQTRDDWQIDV